VAGVAIVRERGARAGSTSRHQGTHLPRWLVHDPEPIAAKMIHVRIGDHNHRSHRHHGFERVAAFGKHRTSGLGGGEMRRADDGRGGGRLCSDPSDQRSVPRQYFGRRTIGS